MTPEKEQQLFDSIQSIQTDLTKKEQQLFDSIQSIKTDLNKLTADVEKSNDKFANYQQATQWVVQIAFSLIASATIVILVSNILGKR